MQVWQKEREGGRGRGAARETSSSAKLRCGIVEREDASRSEDERSGKEGDWAAEKSERK